MHFLCRVSAAAARLGCCASASTAGCIHHRVQQRPAPHKREEAGRNTYSMVAEVKA
ncbi:hypothetical protein [Rothia mucilaginosa]|uniref:hypothetical protein n=1 Tax=Rothia mucilaginosa TaxID=43675 RepID=UPI0028D74D71|nr:hypothetical protein [Rothia mucilaginosa]